MAYKVTKEDLAWFAGGFLALGYIWNRANVQQYMPTWFPKLSSMQTSSTTPCDDLLTAFNRVCPGSATPPPPTTSVPPSPHNPGEQFGFYGEMADTRRRAYYRY